MTFAFGAGPVGPDRKYRAEWGMKGRKRAVISGCVHHIYQRTLNGELIFYTIRDHLVHFSILSVCARRYRLTILALCQMPEHLHLTAKPLSKKQLADFVRDATACFVREYNRAVGRTGPLFDSRFGSAPKTKEKKVRENLVYVYNNAGERGLCTYAEEYPWNFLAYATSEHPFSNPFVYSKASWRMKKAVREAKARARSGDFLRYSFLERIFAGLDREESAQLSDMLVRLYYFIDLRRASLIMDPLKKCWLPYTPTLGPNMISEKFSMQVRTGSTPKCRWSSTNLEGTGISAKQRSLPQMRKSGCSICCKKRRKPPAGRSLNSFT